MGNFGDRNNTVFLFSIPALTRPSALLMSVMMLTACAGTVSVPVTDRSSGTARSNYRVVQVGDTLYGIAWDVGLDFQTLARWNGIDSPYVVRPGQRLRITPPPRSHRPPRSVSTPPSKPRSAHKRPAPKTGAADQTLQTSAWVWPTTGRLSERFAPVRGQKGIDITGIAGQPVLAAAGGRVVYAGTGLRGYGMLIIVKHNETFLSAYAHNRKILVKEGKQVRRGERIAEMGNTGTNRVKLHFEIRRRGVPVNPMRYLPKR